MSVVEVNKDNFENEVLNSTTKVLVDFNAEWCGPCKMLKPIIDELAEERTDLKIVSINIDDEDELLEDDSVFSIPCLVLFDKGKELKRNVGLMSKDDLETFIGE